MSRAFVKESDGDNQSNDFPVRPQSPFTNYVTPTGIAQLRSQVAELAIRTEQLRNAEGLSSRQLLAQAERDLRFNEDRLRRAVLVQPSPTPPDKVHFGATVDVLSEDGALLRFAIVGEDEADTHANKISWISPLAHALLGHRVGETVVWRRPAGDLEIEIVAII